jgi:DNA-binding XRE family transcriptional regulator
LKAEKPKLRKYRKKLETLGDHIRKKRLELGLLQSQAAKHIGVDGETLGNERSSSFRSSYLISSVSRIYPLTAPTTLLEMLLTARKVLGVTQRAAAKTLAEAQRH